jgi:hypothetical protein
MLFCVFMTFQIALKLFQELLLLREFLSQFGSRGAARAAKALSSSRK